MAGTQLAQSTSQIHSRRSSAIQYHRAVADGRDSTRAVDFADSLKAQFSDSVPSPGTPLNAAIARIYDGALTTANRIITNRDDLSLTAADHPAHRAHSRSHYSVLFRSKARPCCHDPPKVNACIPNNLLHATHAWRLPLTRLEQAQVFSLK